MARSFLSPILNRVLAILMLAATAVIGWQNNAHAAHPLRLTDYSDQSRIGLEIGWAELKDPIPADAYHYLLGVEINLAPGAHLRIALPFSGYSGIGGSDNFIRGNMLLGGSYRFTITDWLAVGAGLRLYLPTFERADSVDFGLPQEPRRAALAHWHYRFQYALDDSFPIVPEVAVRFHYAGFFAQLETAMTLAPNVRKREEVVRKDFVWLLGWGAGIGYDFYGWVELSATLTGLIDFNDKGENLGDVLGLAANRPRSLHAIAIGPRFQYKWFAIKLETNIPLEAQFRDMLQPAVFGEVQIQFP